MTNVKHSSESSNWYTPVPVIEAARKVLGTIDLDPASDTFGNSRVKAKRYFTQDGADPLTAWHPAKTLFINPPGGKLGNKSQTLAFWHKLMLYRNLAIFQGAIFVAFSIEALQVSQGYDVPSMGEFPLCIPSTRLKFDKADGTKPSSPTHANAIIYVPGNIDKTALFFKAYSHIGVCR